MLWEHGPVFNNKFGFIKQIKVSNILPIDGVDFTY